MSKIQNQINVAIVGCGKIGYEGYVKKNIDSHYKALSKLSNFNLKLFDKDSSKGDPNFVLNKDKFDAIIVAVNTEFHYEVYSQAVSKNPKLIILEKPAGGSLEEFKKIRSLGFNKTIVNYPRRLIRDMDYIKELIKANGIGATLHIECMYNKALNVNGCHFIDTVIYLYGPPMSFTRTDSLLTLHYPGFNCNLIRMDAKKYTEQHIHIYGTHSKIEINQGGMEQRLYEKMDHPCGYKSLTHAITYVGTLFDSCGHIPELIENNIKEEVKVVPSSLADAYHTIKVMYE